MTMAINNNHRSANTNWPTSVIPNPNATNSRRNRQRPRLVDPANSATSAAAEENVLRNNTNTRNRASPVVTAAGTQAMDSRATNNTVDSSIMASQHESIIIPSKMARASFEIELPYHPPPPTPAPAAPPIHPPPPQPQQLKVPPLNNSISSQTTDSSNNSSKSSTEKSWGHRMRWLRNTRAHRTANLEEVNPNHNSNNNNSAAAYYGGAMESEKSSNKNTNSGGDGPAGIMKTDKHHAVRYGHNKSATGSAINERAGSSQSKHEKSASSALINNNNTEIPSTPQYHPPSPFRSIASWLTGSSSQHMMDDEDSLHDFDESEWTPPDSSYGAAIPVGGWIPKNIRRSIEFSLVTLAIVALVYAVVTTSIRLSDDAGAYHDNHDGQNDNGGHSLYYLDDDRYITYGDDDRVVAATDDDGVYNSTYYNASMYTDDDVDGDDEYYDDDNNNEDGERWLEWLFPGDG